MSQWHSVTIPTCTMCLGIRHTDTLCPPHSRPPPPPSHGLITPNYPVPCIIGHCAESFSHVQLRWPSVPNFSGQSRILRACPDVIRQTTSFGTLNCPEFQILSEFVPMSHMSRCVAVQAVDQNAVDHFDVFALQRCVLLSSIRTKSIFSRGPVLEKFMTLPQTLESDGEGNALIPLPPRRLRRLDLGVVAASKSVPNFHHRFRSP